MYRQPRLIPDVDNCYRLTHGMGYWDDDFNLCHEVPSESQAVTAKFMTQFFADVPINKLCNWWYWNRGY